MSETIHRTRQGLLETAGGLLRCPQCREVLTDIVATYVYRPEKLTTVLPRMLTVTEMEDPPVEWGASGQVAVALSCTKMHTAYVRVSAKTEGLSVTTEWDEPREER